MDETAVFDGQSPAIFEVMDEGLVKLRLAEIILLDLYVYLVILQVFGVKLLTSSKISIDLIQLQRFLRGNEDLLLLIIKTRLK